MHHEWSGDTHLRCGEEKFEVQHFSHPHEDGTRTYGKDVFGGLITRLENALVDQGRHPHLPAPGTPVRLPDCDTKDEFLRAAAQHALLYY